MSSTPLIDGEGPVVRHGIVRPVARDRSWDTWAMGLAEAVALKSKDVSTRVGCVILGAGHEILTVGYNGLPRGCDDHVPERQQRPLKYTWFEHAERNAIYNAARVGVRLLDGILYTTLFPCSDCARGIVQVGIVGVVYRDEGPKRWADDMEIASQILSEGGVGVRKL